VDLEALRLDIYRTFAETGHPPDITGLADRLKLESKSVTRGLRQLAHARHIVLDEADRILMAHPFSALPMGFAIMGARTLWWGGCAWDSFALPNLLRRERDILISTRCPACSSPHAWNVARDRPPVGDQVAHFLVPADKMWDNVVHTCTHQQVFCSTECVETWLIQTGHTVGYLMDLATLWRLAEHWYDGRLDSGYVRREPARAKEYLYSVGLDGPFWGL
jgi:hypothetical protein